MSDIICPSCGRPNLDGEQICQFCGGILKKDGQAKVKPDLSGNISHAKNATDPGKGVSGWLKDRRKASRKEDEGSPPDTLLASSDEQNKADAPMPDFLAGFSRLANEDEEETPDWMKNLQVDVKIPQSKKSGSEVDHHHEDLPGISHVSASPDEKMPGDNPSISEELNSDSSIYVDVPDWLSGLAGADDKVRFSLEEEPSSEQSFPPENDALNWLASLEGNFSEGEAFSFENLPEEGSVSPANSEAEIGQGTQEVYQSPFSGDVLDWMASLEGQKEEVPAEPGEAPGSESAAQAAEDLPDWMASLQGLQPSASEPGPEQPESPFSADVSDWMASLEGQNEEPPAQPGEAPGSESAAQAAEDLPDWMASLQELQPSASEPEPEQPELPFSADVSDWMASLEGQNEESPAQPGESPGPESAAQTAEDLPDWMANLQGLQSSASEPGPEQPELPFSADVSDWMAGLERQNEESPAQPGESPGPESAAQTAEDLPDWMASLQGLQPSASEPGPEQSEFPTVSAVPAFVSSSDLDDIAMSVPEKSIEPTPQQKPFFEDEISSSSHSEEINLPGAQSSEENGTKKLFAHFQGMGSAGTGGESSQLIAPSMGEEALRLEVGALMPDQGAEQNIVDSIFSAESPDWLSGFTAEEDKPEQQKKSLFTYEKSLSGLEAADLPTWVQAMRPVESVAVETADFDEERILEQEGPLAGLHSVLPSVQVVEPVRQTAKPVSNLLMVTGSQQAQIVLLQNLLNSESTPHSVPRRSRAVTHPLYRIVIALMLFSGLVLVAALGTSLFPEPGIAGVGASITSFYNAISSLPDGAVVLVVVDYQPGFAGEMEAAAGTVLEHLMSKSARIAFVSTSPFGDYLAERFVNTFQGVHSYQKGVQFETLGYLPGGVSGIKAFVDQPAQSVGYDFTRGNLWESPVLRDVVVDSGVQISSFSAVVVVTENPDLGRIWVEQMQTVLKDRPLLMVASAQAEPMLRPYFDSGQLDGLVAGLEGGMGYEIARGISGQAHANWDVFGTGILLMVVIIIFGSVAGFFAGSRTKQAQVNEGEV